MRFDIISLFPDIFSSYINESIIKRAIENETITIKQHNLRDYTDSKHNKVDDKPFGGGAGMLIMPQPLWDCIQAVKKENKGPVIFLTPHGKRLTQNRVETLSRKYDQLILLCGHYEGIDQRIRDNLVDLEISIGDYVLTGGELPALVLLDSITRLLPGVLGKEDSHLQDSFSKALNRKKEYPHYTRPANFKGYKVPEVLLSGNHKKIEEWRNKNLT